MGKQDGRGRCASLGRKQGKEQPVPPTLRFSGSWALDVGIEKG
jgi:hypothetical protein